MSAPPVLLTHPPTEDEQGPTDEGLDLSALLDLLATPGTAAPGRSLRGPSTSRGTQLQMWLHLCSRRAAGWGAGPQGSWRAW